MHILITGAGGNLASGIIAPLASRHELRLADVVPVETPHEFLLADVRDPDALIAAAGGIDVIVHTPAWHGIHLSSRREREFWELNVGGTFNLFQAADANDVRKVVWMSSQSVHANDTIYGVTKIVGEELCQFYHRVHGIRCIMLRPADFTPYRTTKQYGERLLRGGVDRRDVQQAAILAVENETVACEAFAVVREDPFTAEDVRSWPHDPRSVLERAFPGAWALVERFELELPERIAQSDISAIHAQLGYRPRYNFFSFLGDLAQQERHGDAASWLARTER